MDTALVRVLDAKETSQAEKRLDLLRPPRCPPRPHGRTQKQDSKEAANEQAS